MEHVVNLSFGELLKELRKLRCLSQEDLSFKSSISVPAIRLLEKNLRHPRPHTIKCLIDGLQIPDSCQGFFISSANDGEITAHDYQLILLGVKGYLHHPPIHPLSPQNININIGKPQTEEANNLQMQFRDIVKSLAFKVSSLPFRVFIWEPENVKETEVEQKRREIHHDLTQRGLQAFFREEYADPNLKISNHLSYFASAKFAQACIVIIEDSLDNPSSVDVVLDFCEYSRKVSRIFLMLPKKYRQRLKSHVLIRTLENESLHKVCWFTNQDFQDSLVRTMACDHIEMQRVVHALERIRDD